MHNRYFHAGENVPAESTSEMMTRVGTGETFYFICFDLIFRKKGMLVSGEFVYHEMSVDGIS